MMNIRNCIPALAAAGFGALAIAVAPAAAATPGGADCTNVTSTSTLCQRPGNAEFSATPPAVQTQPQYPFLADGGLLFHHHSNK